MALPTRGLGWAGKTPVLGASPVPGRAIPPLLPSHTVGRRSPRRLVLLCSASAPNFATQKRFHSAGCLSELAHVKLSPQYPRTALSGEGPMPKSSSWALGAADAGFMAAGTCRLACRGCLTAGEVTPRSTGLNGPGCCRLGGRGTEAQPCVVGITEGLPFTPHSAS